MCVTRQVSEIKEPNNNYDKFADLLEIAQPLKSPKVALNIRGVTTNTMQISVYSVMIMFESTTSSNQILIFDKVWGQQNFMSIPWVLFEKCGGILTI